MSLDGFVLNAHCLELNATYRGAKLEKVHQPTANTLTLQLSSAGKRHRLVASVDPQLPRLVVSSEQLDNPHTPPFFCLLLRKHIEGSRLERISMPGFERVIFLDFASRDELGNPATFRLCVELTGRHSNIILTRDNAVIVDAIKRISLNTSTTRPLLPGLKYELPPTQDKQDPRSIGAKDIMERLSLKAVPSILSDTVQGLSQLLAREIAHRHDLIGLPSTEVTLKQATAMVNEIGHLASRATTESIHSGYIYRGDKVLFHVFPLTHLNIDPLQVEGINATIALALGTATATQSTEVLRQRLRKTIHTHTEKNVRKTAALNEDIRLSQQRDEFKRYGELLYANIGTCKITGAFAEVTDFYSESLERVHIPIDPKLGHTDNAKAYFKRYNRALNTEKHGLERLKDTSAQQEYLLTLETSIEHAEELSTLREIEAEMREQGLMPKAPVVAYKKRVAPASTGPRRFVSPDGLSIEVGRNNLQNEQLVKQASPSDVWLHVQKAPGSHVLIHAQGDVPESTLLFAANLAAYYSSQRSSALVPVDYTERKHVKRPNGAKPGFVIYENQQTIYVRNPKEPEAKQE
ncbi:MAG: fibronectin-binding A domain protein [Bacillota bacterium]|nr:MAG: fibronectin-binding A domain protein [Bacillota bacterium]MBS3949666.1 NFACT family protein [Peptococcaceae bacterium]